MSRKTARPAGAHWHADLSYDRNPSDVTFLYGVQIPSQGGDTLFADLRRAYETLPAATRARIDGMTAIHRYGWRSGASRTALTPEQKAAHPDAEHPVVRTHAETGRKALYVNGGHTVNFEGMTPQESAPLLEYLYGVQQRPEFSCRFQWREGDVAFWDNRAAQHNALNDYHGYRRVMWRVTLAGDVPA